MGMQVREVGGAKLQVRGAGSLLWSPLSPLASSAAPCLQALTAPPPFPLSPSPPRFLPLSLQLQEVG